MNEPHITAKDPVHLELPPGTYSWCSCGYTADDPFCDGKHIGKGFCPVTLKISDPKTVALCRCRQSRNRPYCDGSHRQLV